MSWKLDRMKQCSALSEEFEKMEQVYDGDTDHERTWNDLHRIMRLLSVVHGCIADLPSEDVNAE